MAVGRDPITEAMRPDERKVEAGAGDAAECHDGALRPDAITAPSFQREVLRALGAEPDVEARSLGPFLIEVAHGGRRWELRLDELFKRYRHGALEPAAAADEVKAAVRLPGASIQAGGPFPRLARPEALDPSTLRRPCPFDADLAVFYVWELPHGHIPLTRSDLERDFEGNLDLLEERAMAALSRRSTEVPAESQGEGERRVLGYVSGDGLDASRALLTHLLQAMSEWIAGRLHVAIPSRDVLMVIGDADPRFLRESRAEIERLYERSGPERLSNHLYVLGSEGLSPAPAP